MGLARSQRGPDKARMNLAIRPADPADIAAMHRIRCSVRENRLSDPARITEACYLPYVESGSAWVAENERGLAGFAAVDRAGSSVWALFVDPEMEGAGVGRALHDHMVEWARAQGLERLALSTAPGTRAEHFYVRMGWQADGLTPDGERRFVKRLG